jgi:copper resistance protein C
MNQKWPFALLITAMVISCLVGLSPSILSHAVLLETIPAADSTTTGPNVSVRLRFNVRIDRNRSRLTLVLPDGKSVSLKIDEESAPDSLLSRANGLMSGDYHLRWQVLAIDGHITRGEVPFRVKSP